MLCYVTMGMSGPGPHKTLPLREKAAARGDSRITSTKLFSWPRHIITLPRVNMLWPGQWLAVNASFDFSEIVYSSLWMTSDLLSVRSAFLRFEF